MTTVLTMVVNSCTDYPNLYGFEVYMSDTERSFTVFPDGYNVTFKTPVCYNEGTGITNYGYTFMDGCEIPAEFVKTDENNGYLTATLSGLMYENNYAIQPFLGDNNEVRKGLEFYLSVNKSILYPICISSEQTMNASGEVVLSAVYSCATIPGAAYTPVTKATVTFGGQEIKTIVSEDGTIVNAVIGNLGSYAAKEYSGITINATNDFGTVPLKYDYKAKVEDISQIYPDDGNEPNYIKLCGIKWAKGNFIVENGNGRIQANQWDAAKSYNAYFCAANGKLDILKKELDEKEKKN